MSALALRRAIAHEEFVLHYQPQVRLADGVTTGSEALVRWRTPSGPLLAPADFIPLAKAYGLMPAIDDLVLRVALHDFAEGRLAGDDISVNCSASSVDAGMPRRVSEALRHAHVAPACLIIEVTEDIALRSGPVVDRATADLAGMGVTLAMDDYGAGSARLSTLIDIPYHRLKFDRHLTAQLVGRHPRRAAIFMRGIVALASHMGLAVVAEGIETDEEASAARDADVRMAQGFLFGRPEPASEALRAR